MDRIKVINALEWIKNNFYIPDGKEVLEKMVDQTIEDVKRCIPIELDRVLYICPVCGTKIENASATMNKEYNCFLNYCTRCGQALRW